MYTRNELDDGRFNLSKGMMDRSDMSSLIDSVFKPCVPYKNFKFVYSCKEQSEFLVEG